MKLLKLITANIIFASVAWAGNEIPWPINAQEAVRIQDLTGTWVSMSLQDPGYLYFFYVEKNPSSTNKYSCPYLLTVEEMNPFNQTIVSAGWSVFCQITQNSMTFNLYDQNGQYHGKIDIVGVRKDEGASGLGKQHLGVKIFDESERPVLKAADVFFKYSNDSEPVWPPMGDYSVESAAP
ncbi:MAG: hypothetical protein H6623_09430 [Bdellovibrionaceae bacterium]|nr:hypothetical protein [Pseudobdellovibrionaceae bacterium]